MKLAGFWCATRLSKIDICLVKGFLEGFDEFGDVAKCEIAVSHVDGEVNYVTSLWVDFDA